MFGRHRLNAILSLVAAAGVFLFGSASSAMSFTGTGGASRWLGTWGAAMLPPGSTPVSAAGFTDQTVRQQVHVTVQSGSPSAHEEGDKSRSRRTEGMLRPSHPSPPIDTQSSTRDQCARA